MAADGERIAPVTYLFGAAPKTEDDDYSADHSPSAAVPAVSASFEAAQPETGPRFVDLGEQPSGITESDITVSGRTQFGGNATRTSRSRSTVAKAEPFTAEPAKAERAKASASEKSKGEKSRGSFDRISNVSMYALARRGMSSREMRDYLVGREFESSEVDAEIERLENVALLDDLALAETLIRTLQSRKGLGRSALTAELRRRNVDPLAIETALAALEDDDELERAVAIAVKRAGQLRSLDATTAKRRLGDFLMRRGYSGSVVSKAVQEALAPAGPTFR
ncbi:regulatory protein RecX [Salinibacterium sp. CAN_S4]|uniref:regulatory protein RecX n=1 Tax=Salinibacterium sp. CAN_S4 TaxID=2787727 RepID=UPI002FF36D76